MHFGQGGTSCAIPTTGNPCPGAILHTGYGVIYLTAQTRTVTPSKEEAKSDQNQLLPPPKKNITPGICLRPNTTSRAPMLCSDSPRPPAAASI